LQHFAHVYAPKPSQKQISQHFLALWEHLEQEVKTRAAENMSNVLHHYPLGFTRICQHFFSGFFRLAYQRPLPRGRAA